MPKLSDQLAGKKIGVLGVGTEGAATVRWLIAKGVVPAVADKASQEQLGKTYDELSKLGVTDWRLGDDYLENLDDFDIIFRTPLLPASDPHLQRTTAAVTSHIRLFIELCPAPIIGITGTKGKGTTAGLIHAMLKTAGKDSHLGGNIGTPPLEFLDKLTEDSIVVLELSSFQLEDLDRSPQVAVVTNVTEDHLDRHRDVAEYRAAKRSLVAHQSAEDVAILNKDDAGSKAMAEVAGGHVQWFSTKGPVSPGAYADGQTIVFETGGDLTEVCSPDDIQVPGKHNQANVLAAILATHSFDVDPKAMRTAIKDYRGLPYHLEFVAEVDGVRFFNDSYATSPTATIPAVESFDDPVVLIVGGSEKGLDYAELGKVIATRNIRGLVLIPPEGTRIAEAVAAAGADVAIKTAGKKEDIVPAALELAQSGDVVLFSPAAASFGWFDSYTDRGMFFNDSVKAL